VAPDARILPVRVVDREEPVDPVVLARGIWYATDHGARVINLSIAGTEDNRYVRDAVAHARAADVVVVAATGNQQRGSQRLPSFPAAYDGVLGVGAVDQAAKQLSSSQTGPYLDLVAPGGGVLAATRAGGHQYWEGTSFAAAFVSGVAALVRQAWPRLSAGQVVRRILATATPAPGGVGLVNPGRAVLDGLVSGRAAVLPPVSLRPAAAARAAPPAATWPLVIGSCVALVIVLVGAPVLRRGRRHHWRPRRAAAVAEVPVPADPPDHIFTL